MAGEPSKTDENILTTPKLEGKNGDQMSQTSKSIDGEPSLSERKTEEIGTTEIDDIELKHDKIFVVVFYGQLDIANTATGTVQALCNYYALANTI